MYVCVCVVRFVVRFQGHNNVQTNEYRTILPSPSTRRWVNDRAGTNFPAKSLPSSSFHQLRHTRSLAHAIKKPIYKLYGGFGRELFIYAKFGRYEGMDVCWSRQILRRSRFWRTGSHGSLIAAPKSAAAFLVQNRKNAFYCNDPLFEVGL